MCVCLYVKLMSFRDGVQYWDGNETPRGQATFTRICFYTGNPNCRFSTRYLENGGERGRAKTEREREDRKQRWRARFTNDSLFAHYSKIVNLSYMLLLLLCGSFITVSTLRDKQTR